MPIGKNISFGGDRLLGRKPAATGEAGGRDGGTARPPGRPRRQDTVGTRKMTFYVKGELLENLYNFAYWERLSVTAAFNRVLADGLRDKNVEAPGGDQ